MSQIEEALVKPPTDMPSSSLDNGLNSAPFSIRGYVAAVREVNIKKCWPFSSRLLEKCLDEGKDPLLPPLAGSYSSCSRDCYELEGSFSTRWDTKPTSSAAAVGTGLLGQQIELRLDLKGKISEHTSEDEQVLSQRYKESAAEAIEDEAEDKTGNIYQRSDTRSVVQTLGVHPGLHVDDGDAKNSGAVAIEPKSNEMIERATSEKTESSNGNEDLISSEEKRSGNPSNAEDVTRLKSVGNNELLSLAVHMQVKDGNEDEVIKMCDPLHKKEEGSAGDEDLTKEEIPDKYKRHADVMQEAKTLQLMVRDNKNVRHFSFSFSSSPEEEEEEEEEESSEQELYAMEKRFSELEDVMAITDAQKCPICVKFQSCSNIALNAHIDHCLAIAEKTGAVKEKKAKSKVRKKRSMAELCSVAPKCSVEGSQQRQSKNRSSNNILRKKRGHRLPRGRERIAESLTGKKRRLVKELQSSALRKKRRPSSFNCSSSGNGEPTFSDVTKQRMITEASKSHEEASNCCPPTGKCISSGSSSRTKKNICFRKTESSSVNRRKKLPSRSRKYQLQNFSVKTHCNKKTERFSGVVTKGRSSMKRDPPMKHSATRNRGKLPLSLVVATAELEVPAFVSAKAAALQSEEVPVVSPIGTPHNVYRPIMSVSIPSCDDDDEDDDDAYDDVRQLALPGSVGIGKEVQAQGKDGKGVLQQGCFWKESQGKVGLLPEDPCLKCNMAESRQCTCPGQRSSNGLAMAMEAEQEGQCRQSPNQSILSSRITEKTQSRAVPLQRALHSDVSLLMYSGSKIKSPCLPAENVNRSSHDVARKKKNKAGMKELLDINETCVAESGMDSGLDRAVVVAPHQRRHRQDQLSMCKEVVGQKPGKSQSRKNLSRKMVNFLDEILLAQRSESSGMQAMPISNLPPTQPPAQDTQREAVSEFSFPHNNCASFHSHTDVQQPAIYCGFNLPSQFQSQTIAENTVNTSSSWIGNANTQRPPHQDSPTNQSGKAIDHSLPSNEHAMLSRLGNPGLRLMGKTILNPDFGPMESEMAFENLGGNAQHEKKSNYMVSGASQEGLIRKEILEDGSNSTMGNRSTRVYNDIGLCQRTTSSYNYNGSAISYGSQEIGQPTQPAQFDSVWANQACYDQAFPLRPPVFQNPSSLSWTGECRPLSKAPSVQAPLPPGDFRQPSSNHVWFDQPSIPASYQHIRPIQSAGSVEALTNVGYNVFSSSSQPPFRGPPSVTYNLPMAGTPHNSLSLYLDERNQGSTRLTASPQHYFAHCPCHYCKEANATVVVHPKSPTFQSPYPLASSSSAKGKHVSQETPSWIMHSNTKRQLEENIVIIDDERLVQPPQPTAASSSFFTNSADINKWQSHIRPDMVRSTFPIGMETSRLSISSLPPANHSGKGGIISERVAIPESGGPNQVSMQRMNSADLGFHSRQNMAHGDLRKSRVSGGGNIWPIRDEIMVQKGGNNQVRRDIANRTQHESPSAFSNSMAKANPLSNSLIQLCNSLSEILPGFSYAESNPPCLSPVAGPVGMCTTNMNPAEINIDFQDGTCFVKLPSSMTSTPRSSPHAKASSENMNSKSPSLTNLNRKASENERSVYPLQKERREDTQPFLQPWSRAGQLPIFDSSDRGFTWSDSGKSTTERCPIQSGMQNKCSAVDEETSRSGALLQCGCETYNCQAKEISSLKLVKLTNPGAKVHIVNGRAEHSFVDVPLQREIAPHLIAGNDQNYFSQPFCSTVIVDNVCQSEKSLDQVNRSLMARSSKDSSADLMKQGNPSPCDSIACGQAAACFSLTKRRLQNDSYGKGSPEVITMCSVIPPHSDKRPSSISMSSPVRNPVASIWNPRFTGDCNCDSCTNQYNEKGCCQREGRLAQSFTAMPSSVAVDHSRSSTDIGSHEIASVHSQFTASHQKVDIAQTKPDPKSPMSSLAPTKILGQTSSAKLRLRKLLKLSK